MPGGVIGREEELGSIETFLERVERGPAALFLCGDPGIGKTILWDTGVDRAREREARVLSYRAVEAEATVSFAALSELVGDVFEEALPLLAAPRRRALEVALLLEEPGAQPPDQRAVGLAVVDILRAFSASAPLLVAIDDVQWLDPSSAGVLQFALRRLRKERAGLLATVRVAPGAGLPLELQRAFSEDTVERLAVHPLSLGAAYRLLSERLGLALSRPELVRLHDLTGGNPFYLLELGRELKRTKARLAPGQPLPVPRDVTELLARRLGRLPAWTREVLLTVAALPRPVPEVLEAAHGDSERVAAAVERAAREGVVELEDSRVRFAHPLLASVCYHAAPIWKRRAVHTALAGVISEPEERARHLALAADGPDDAVASVVETAAEHAAARGATAAAAELSELAAELTPTESPALSRRRRLRAASFHRLAGDRDRAATLLERLLVDAAPGAECADVTFALALARRGDLPSITKLCEQALAQIAGDDARCTQVLAFLSWMRLIGGDVEGALAAARDGLRSAERVDDPALLVPAIARVAMAETWALEITPGLVERGVALEESLGRPFEFHESPAIALARRLICLCELDRARSLLEQAETNAAARGDEGTRGHVLFHLIMLEWFASRWERGLEHAAAALELAEQLRDEQYRGMVLHARALVDAHLGRIEAARSGAEEAAMTAQAVSDAIFPIWNRAVLGHIELALGNLSAADQHLRPLPARLVSLGWNDPADSVWPDAIEALVGVGALGQAGDYLHQYEELARRSGGVWALATAARCRGLAEAAEGHIDAAFAAFEHALAEHDRMEGRFERGRTLLALGSARRRARQRGAAREALEAALQIFDEVGARLWARRAQEELGRISGRRPASNGLSPTEERVATLAAGGLANKEIASTLFMSVHTVEAHLSRVYRKLGIHSRAQLAHRGREVTPKP